MVVLYLDVDGVVSALSSRHAFKDGRRVAIGGFDLTLSPSLGRRLDALAAEIRWLTTWGGEAVDVGRRIGVRSPQVAALPPEGGSSAGDWKFEVVRRQVEVERRPFVWIDDEAIPPEAEAWASDLGVPHLLVQPSGNRGISPAEIELIEMFVAAHER